MVLVQSFRGPAVTISSELQGQTIDRLALGRPEMMMYTRTFASMGSWQILSGTRLIRSSQAQELPSLGTFAGVIRLGQSELLEKQGWNRG